VKTKKGGERKTKLPEGRKVQLSFAQKRDPGLIERKGEGPAEGRRAMKQDPSPWREQKKVLQKSEGRFPSLGENF